MRTVSFVPTKSSYIFSKINALYTDTGHKLSSLLRPLLAGNKLSYIVIPALRTLVIYTLPIFIVTFMC